MLLRIADDEGRRGSGIELSDWHVEGDVQVFWKNSGAKAAGSGGTRVARCTIRGYLSIGDCRHRGVFSDRHPMLLKMNLGVRAGLRVTALEFTMM